MFDRWHAPLVGEALCLGAPGGSRARWTKGGLQQRGSVTASQYSLCYFSRNDCRRC